MSLRFLVALTSILLAAPLAAQSPPRPVPENRFALDAEIVGGTLSYANRVRGDWFFGVGAGVGGSLVSRMIVGGRHFGQQPGIVYQTPDEAGEELLFEMGSVNLFARHEAVGPWQTDLGLRASVFLHSDASDDDFGGGVFVGPYLATYWGTRHFKVGPRIMAGIFSEGAGTQEFGVYVAPLTFRIVVP